MSLIEYLNKISLGMVVVLLGIFARKHWEKLEWLKCPKDVHFIFLKENLLANKSNFLVHIFYNFWYCFHEMRSCDGAECIFSGILHHKGRRRISDIASCPSSWGTPGWPPSVGCDTVGKKYPRYCFCSSLKAFQVTVTTLHSRNR